MSSAQVKRALLALFKREIRDTHHITTFALTGEGAFIVKLTPKA